MHEYVKGFALALFELALEQKKIMKFKKDSLAIIKSIENNDNIYSLMSSSFVTNDKKNAFLLSVYKNKIQIEIINTLCILAQKKLFVNCLRIFKKLIKYINDYLKIQTGIIYSPEKLDKNLKQKLEQKLSKSKQVDVELEHKIDKTLIMGFKIEIGNEIIEDSIHTRINALKQNLLRKGDSYE